MNQAEGYDWAVSSGVDLGLMDIKTVQLSRSVLLDHWLLLKGESIKKQGRGKWNAAIDAHSLMGDEMEMFFVSVSTKAFPGEP